MPNAGGTLRDVPCHRSIAVRKACTCICLKMPLRLRQNGLRRKQTDWRTDAPGSTIQCRQGVIPLLGCALKRLPRGSAMFCDSFEGTEYFRFVVTPLFVRFNFISRYLELNKGFSVEFRGVIAPFMVYSLLLHPGFR